MWLGPLTARRLGLHIAVAPLILLAALACAATVSAQGGPPYYTNDPGTPGNKQWEINLGYMPFLYPSNSVSHVPDVDINFGLGDRIQLTYESAWLRVIDHPNSAKWGMEQSQLGAKWRFYDNSENGFSMSVFPQLSLNNPNNAVARGIAPPGASLIVPVEFSKKLGTVDLNWEAGYNFVHLGPDTYVAGVVLGHDFNEKFEMDTEFYATGGFHGQNPFTTLDVGARYKIHAPCILLLMAGRSLAVARNGQPYFVGYFGMQFLLPPHPFAKD